jgi:hypothetical protein
MTVSDEGANRKWDEINSVVLNNSIPAYVGVRGGIGDPKPTSTPETTTTRPAIPVNSKCACNKEYFISFRGILRISIIVG